MHESGKYIMEYFHNSMRDWYVPSKPAGIFWPRYTNIKLVSSRYDLARVERSMICKYAYVERKKELCDGNNPVIPIANTCVYFSIVCLVSSVKRVNEYARSPLRMEIDLVPGRLRGSRKLYTPGKWFKTKRNH